MVIDSNELNEGGDKTILRKKMSYDEKQLLREKGSEIRDQNFT